MCACVCVFERECVCACVRERECVCVCVRERERAGCDGVQSTAHGMLARLQRAPVEQLCVRKSGMLCMCLILCGACQEGVKGSWSESRKDRSYNCVTGIV